MNTVRSEKDSMGAIDVPADKLWGDIKEIKYADG